MLRLAGGAENVGGRKRENFGGEPLWLYFIGRLGRLLWGCDRMVGAGQKKSCGRLLN